MTTFVVTGTIWVNAWFIFETLKPEFLDKVIL